MNDQILIAPSILSADQDNLQAEVESVEPYSDWLHIDVMDGVYVPQVNFRHPKDTADIQTGLLRNFHLMVADPASEVDGFVAAGAGNITFHVEAVAEVGDQRELIAQVQKAGVGVGIAIEPETPLSAVEHLLGEIDLLLVMSVKTGLAGQAFREEVLPKVSEARQRYPDLMIQMDGGISDETAPQCIAVGANNLVSASFIFGSSDRAKAIDSLREK